MSVIGSNILAGASGQGGYFIDRSLRFRSSASAYLSRTFGTPTSQNVWSFSAWVKRGKLGANQFIFWAGTTSTNDCALYFTSSDQISWFTNNGSSVLTTSTAVFRDPSAWYHVVAIANSTTMNVYVNNQQVITSAGMTNNTINSAIVHNIGRDGQTAGNEFDGYLTDINFIDGQALDPTSFGEYNEDTGVWQPIKYVGTYGTNGFYLNFSDNTSTTTLGYDTSGQGNNWTANNISVTSGVTYDSMTDVPTLTSEDAANYATWNPLDKDNGISSVTNGNLKVVTNGSNGSIKSTIAFPSGKWYWEVTSDSVNSGGTQVIGIMPQSQPPTNNMSDSGKLGYALDVSYTDRKFDNGAATSYGSYTQGNGVVYMLAFDQDAGKLWYGVNGTWLASGAPATGSNPSSSSISTSTAYCAAVSDNTVSGTFTANFGQRPFAYTPPTDFKSLNTYNLPDSTIEDGSQYFNTVTYSGTGSSLSIPVGFIPDFTWIKRRNANNNHQAFDVLRGSNVLVPNEAGDESDYSLYFDFSSSDGFDLPNASVNMNNSSGTYVAWNWKANGSGVTNNEGTIESTVSATTTAGFSIVSYIGNGTAGATVGHGLGVAPNMVIVKTRESSNTWRVGHDGLTSWAYQLRLDNTAGQALNNNIFNSTAPTSTVFTVGSSATTNESTKGMVAYCFADVEGYSKFGSYTGNGSADGTFVYLGFRPALVILKRTDSTGGSWVMFDTTRDTYNATGLTLYPNQNYDEDDFRPFIDILSNGFKLRATYASYNSSGIPHIYMAFAENPFKNALAR